MKRVLVMGSTGMAGHQISLYLKTRGYAVEGFSKRPNPLVDGFIGDATNFPLVREILVREKYDYVINCIGILIQAAENNHGNAVLLNAYLPHFLAEVTRSLPTRVIHMSTDCVFSGKRGGYARDDLRDGETFYDRSKALGELDDGKNTTLRNSIVGPDVSENGVGLLNWFMKQKGPVNGYTGAIWTGQTTLQLAKTMDYVMQHEITGLYNAVPESSITKYALLKLFNHYLRNDSVEIVPVEGARLDKSLIATPIDETFVIPGYKEMVREMADWIFSHKELYPHYDL